MIPFLKVIHINNGTTTDLTKYVESCIISKQAEAKKNSVTLALKNPNGKLSGVNFEKDDSTIKVYLDWEPIVAQNPVMVTTLSTIIYPVNESGFSTIKLKGLDKTGLFLSRLWSLYYPAADSLTAQEIIENVINHSQDDALASDKITFNNMATTKSDGSAFPNGISIAKTWKPLYEWINELSSTESTGEDREYTYYLDEDNDLHWSYPYQKQTTTLSAGINSSVTSIAVTSASTYPDVGTISIENEQITYTGISTNTFTGCTRGANATLAAAHSIGEQVQGQQYQQGEQGILKVEVGTDAEGDYNMIIYNAGMTPAGYEYLWYINDPADVGSQLKMKFFDWKGLSQDQFNVDKTTTGWGGSDTDYPTPGGNPLSGGNTYTSTWGVTVDSDSEWQEAFITRLVLLGDSKASSFFRTGRQRFKSQASMIGSLNYSVNEIVTVTQPSQGVTKRLRIKDITHTINNTGWFTSMKFQTDPEAS